MSGRSALTEALNESGVADFALSTRRLPGAQVEDVFATTEAAGAPGSSVDARSNFLSSTPSSLPKFSSKARAGPAAACTLASRTAVARSCAQQPALPFRAPLARGEGLLRRAAARAAPRLARAWGGCGRGRAALPLRPSFAVW